jgi:tetratricopeptide (TPR) repeat protein
MNKLISLFVLIPVLLCNSLSAQPYPADSIIASIAVMAENEEKVKALNSLGLMLSDQDADRAIYYVKQALSLANQLQSVESCANTNMILAELYESRHNYQPSINYYLISIKHFEKLGNELELSRLYNRLGSIYIHNHFDFDQGLNYFNKALGYAIRNNYKLEIANAYSHIGDFYYDQGQLDEALNYHLKAFETYELLNNRKAMAASYNVIGEIHLLNNNYDKASDFINKAIDLNEKGGYDHNLAINYKNLAEVFTNKGQSERAREFFSKSRDIIIKTGNRESLIDLYNQLGKHYSLFSEYDSAIETFNRMKELSSELRHLEGLRDAHLGLSKTYENLGNTRKALDYYKLYTHFKDTLFTISRTEQLGELQTRFGLDLKEKELALKDNQITLLQREQKLIKSRQLLLILSLSLLLILSVLIYNRLQQRNRKNSMLMEQKDALNKARQSLMETELKTKNNELVNFAIHLVEKNKFLEELRNDLKKIRGVSEEERENKLKELSLTVQKNIKLQKDLEEFQKNVDHTHQEFFNKLRRSFPDLTKNEERLCAMLRLNLSSKEIAALSNISVRAVEMGRYRLRKKLKIPFTTSLIDYLKEI